MHHKSIIYNKPTRCNSSSIVFINNYKYALHVLDALCAQNMYSILVVVNKHNTARVAPCWFIIYYDYNSFSETDTLKRGP